MSKGPPEDDRTRLLRRLRGRKLDRIRYRAQDAVVIRASGSKPLPPHVRAAIGGSDCRWYPQRDGTHLVKWLHMGGTPPRGARIEPGGWDHEHCAGCNRQITPGRTFWQTARGACVWLCPYCYRRLRTLCSP